MDKIPNFFISLASVLLLDTIWLSFTNDMYMSMFNEVQGIETKIRWIPAFLAWILLALSISNVAFPLSQRYEGFTTKLLVGAFVGLIVYGVYNTTNLATLNNYTWKVAVMDTLWGTIISSTTLAILLFKNDFV